MAWRHAWERIPRASNGSLSVLLALDDMRSELGPCAIYAGCR